MPQVMVVDDSRTQRMIIGEYLSNLECDIVICESGETVFAIELECELRNRVE